MRKREDLKVGDRVIVLYREGYGNPSTAYEAEITKITKERISVKGLNKKKDGSEGTRMDFTNDDKMCHVSLLYSNYQHCNLFLGDVKEAKAADDKRVECWELFLEAKNLLDVNGENLPSSTLRKIIHLIKKEINES